MDTFRHTWLFEPGTWTAAGRFWDEGRREHEAHGTSIVRHTDAAWEIEGSMELGGEPPVQFRNNYRIAAPREDARILPWQSDNPTIGRLTGVFFVEGDTILSSFHSSEGGFVGSEHMTFLAPDRYRARGLFLRSGAIVCAWSMDLEKANELAYRGILPGARCSAEVGKRSSCSRGLATSRRATGMRSYPTSGDPVARNGREAQPEVGGD